jgi:hypothetical protein
MAVVAVELMVIIMAVAAVEAAVPVALAVEV